MPCKDEYGRKLPLLVLVQGFLRCCTRGCAFQHREWADVWAGLWGLELAAGTVQCKVERLTFCILCGLLHDGIRVRAFSFLQAVS